MEQESGQAYCTNVKWIGRAHCGKCHIRQLMLFSELPDTAFDHLLQPIDQYIYPPGSVIYEVNSGKNFLYSIRRGMVKLVHSGEDGSRIGRLLGPGAAIGLELLEEDGGYHHTAVAVTEVDLCKIPVTTTRQLTQEYPELCAHVGQQLQNQLDIADQWIVALSTGSARQRVAQLLLALDRFFSAANGEFVLLSREDMAAITGISVETVSRMIAEFKRKKILQRYRDNFYMCNATALEQIARQS